MLTNTVDDEDLVAYREQLKAYIPEEVLPYFIANNKETELSFPVLEYPTKVKSLNLEKDLSFTGTLSGIKGQYLLFKDQTVFNIRGNEGLYVSLSISS